jgi:hypothetical protein
MSQKIAVAVIHGIGKQGASFADKMIEEIHKRCRPTCGEDIVIRAVYWAPVMQKEEETLWERMLEGGLMDFVKLRRFLIDFMADALAYQPSPSDRSAYDGIHKVFADTIHTLAEEAGERAPLCIIAHSLGSVIASNYIYDLQVDAKKKLIANTVRESISATPLERGETLTLLYTLGSPIGLWSLRYTDFGKPIQVPSQQLSKHFPQLQGEWVNYYDADDVVGFPLKTLNKAYGKVVKEDRQINVGNIWGSWNPLSHLAYWTDKDVLEPIASKLIETWVKINAV